MKKQRLLELDSLRGIAALAVVFYHYFFRYNKQYGHEFLNPEWMYIMEWAKTGKYGVQFFFMISGFVIYWTLNRVEKPADFIVSRFSRLYPVYWVAILITFSVVHYFGLTGREVDFNNAIKNFFMFQYIMGIPFVDGVYWTLTIEVTFYFCIFIIYLFKQLKNAELWMTTVILLSILKNLNIVHVPEYISNIMIINHICFFVAGICFFKIQNNISSKLTFIALIISLLSTIVIFSFRHFLLFCIFFIIFFFAISGKFKFLTIKPLVFFGSISYSLYLIHQNIGYVIINQFYLRGFSGIYGIGVAILTTILLAYLLTKYVEKPSLRIIRETYKTAVVK